MSPKRSLNLKNEGVKKRSRKSVSLETKLDVLHRIDASEKIVDICKALALAKSTVQTIRANKEKINAHSQSAAPLSVSKLTRQRSSTMEKMEKLLSVWIKDNNQRRMPMSQLAIQEKAKNIFEHLKSEDTGVCPADETFLASRGWFDKFKNRHNLLNIKMKGETVSTDADIALAYQNILRSIIERRGYIPQQVFNMGETALYWKQMPERSYISKNERAASGYKVSKERITLLLGANAEGDFKLKPVSAYASENPRALKGNEQYTNSESFSNEELIQLETNRANDEEQEEPVVCRQLTSKDISNALTHFEQGINILVQNDPNEERSAKVSRGINTVINCYKELQNEKKRETIQQTLDKFFKLGPQTTKNYDTNEVMCIHNQSDSKI